MRVSTRGSFLRGFGMMQQLQQSLDKTQQQISTGRRILNPSDDPIAASRALGFRESISRLEQFDRNANIASNRLAQEESALSTVNNVLQRVRELTLQANNATQSPETRGIIAVELRQQLDQLVQLANQKDGTGNHLFSGNLNDTKPVSVSGTTYSYNGDQGQRLIQIGEGRNVADSDSGAAVFFAIREGNGEFTATASAANSGSGILGVGNVIDPTVWDRGDYTISFIDSNTYEVRDSTASVVSTGPFESGDAIAFQGIEVPIDGEPEAGDGFTVRASRTQSVFESVAQIATALERGDNDDIRLNNDINTGLQNIDQAIGNILDVRTQVGSRLSAIENQIDTNGAYALTYRETLASIEDLDYAEAISRLSLEASTLEAAQQSFIRTQSLSLFRYL